MTAPMYGFGVSDIPLDEALAALRAPKKIWAPNGMTFVLLQKENVDAKDARAIFSSDFIHYMLTGPDEMGYTFLFNAAHEIIPDPEHDELPRFYPYLAGLALDSWDALCSAAPNY
jgi:hypothetical protein